MKITIVMRRTSIPGVEEGNEIHAETIYEQELRDDIRIESLVIDAEEPSGESTTWSVPVGIGTAASPESYTTEEAERRDMDRVFKHETEDPFVRDPAGNPTGYRQYETEGYGDVGGSL